MEMPMDQRGRLRRIELRVEEEREARCGAAADLFSEAWRRRCEAFYVLGLSPADRDEYLFQVRLARRAEAALRLMDDSLALERELFTPVTQDSFESLFA